MKLVLFGLLAALSTSKWVLADDCPQAKQVSCVDDTRAAYQPCKKAAETGGKDMEADINCMKYAAKMRSDCWPCICAIAHKEKFQIKGC